MATRMQQRRGLASQWISTNSGNGPILAPGEIGFESDTNKFKIGDGVNHWVDLDYFTTDSAEAITQQINTAISGLVDGAPGLLNTLNELAAAINDDPAFFTTIATDLSDHTSATTNVHGILDTAELATKEYVTTEIGNSEVDQATLAGFGIDWNEGTQKFDVDTILIQERVTGVSDAEIGYLSGVTSDIQTQLNGKLESADLDEAAQEAVNTALVAGIGLDKTYDDLANTITIDIDSTVATKTYADEAADAAQTAAELTASGALSTHSSDTTSVHGITDTAELATKTFAAELLTNATKTNVTITGDKNGLTITAENGVADSNTDNLTEGSTNKYFTDERAQDAVGNSVGTGLTYTDSTGEIKVTPNTYDAYGSASAVAGDLSTHASDTTDIHGIADTSLLATKAYADAAVAAVVDAAPASLNTLKELATALADDANYATTVNNALAAKAPLASPAFSGTVTGITKAMVGLGSVDNTADTAKPVSDATQTALNLKAPIDSPTFTGTIGGITKSMVGLGNVDNTSDANKPVSTAAQSALDLKAPLANPTFTGTVSGITKSMVGLANVDNTSDASKPVSTATQTALDAKASLSGATFTGSVEVDGNLVVDGDFTVNGTNFAASATSIIIEDNLVQLAHQNAGNTVDLGVVVGYNDGAAKHAGIVRDVSTDKWKLFKGVTTEPTTTVDFTQGSLDDLELNAIVATSATIGNVSNEELQHLNGVTSGVQSQLDAKLATSTASSTYATIANVDLKAPLANPTFTGTVAGVTKAHVGLGNVDNTSDADKPVSSATQTALDLKAPLASPTFTGTVTLPTGTVTSGMILDGTIVDGDISSSAAIAQSKVSGLTTDLGLKAPLESPALTGTPTAPTAAAGTNTTQVATTAFVGTAVADLVASAPSALNTLNELATALGNDASFSTTVTNSLAAKAPLNSPTFTGTVSGISKSMVGLENVDNTSDVSKPISNATQTALDLKAPLANPTFTGTVAGVTKAHVGLGNVDNTADSAKPVSTAQQTALNAKAPLESPTFTGTVDFAGATVTGIPAPAAATPNTLGTVYGSFSTSSPSKLFFGYESGKVNTGDNNLGVGYRALYNNTTGTQNTALGQFALYVGSSGISNVAVGQAALYLTTGNSNTALGFQSGFNLTTGSQNTIIGHLAAFNNGTGALTTGSNNIIIGNLALTSSPTVSNEITLGNTDITRFRIPGLGIDWDTDITTTDTELNYLTGVTSAVQTQLNNKAPLDSPALTGSPTAPTQSAGDNSTKIATTAYADAAVAALVDSAPSTLDTLNELAAALGNDANYATTITTALGNKAPLESPTFTGTVDFTAATVTGIPGATPSSLGTVYGNVLTDNGSTEFGQTSLGYNSGSSAYYSTAIGSGAMGSGENSTVIGYGAVVTGNSSTVVGKGASSQYHDNSTAIGAQAATDASNQIVLGNGYVTNLKIPGLGIDWTSSTVPGASPMTTGTYTLTSDTVETIDSVEFGTWSTIEYTLSLKQYSKVRSSKIIVQTNGTDVDMSEYAITETGGSMTGVSVTAILGGMASAAALQVVVTDASSTNVDVKFSKVVL